ncbi:MAG: GPW/gp25 family protein [Cyclobacteriaceae bacterium]
MAENDILGTGWAFPPSFDKHSGETEMLSGADDVENSISLILHTKIGERIMRRTFGSNIHELIFEPLNQNMKSYMSATLAEALSLNEPRIEVTDLTLKQDDPYAGRVDIHISYLNIKTQIESNLVVPYLLPDNS